MDADSATGVVIGLLLGGIRIVSMASAGPMWMYKWFRLQQSPRADAVLNRLQFALTGYDRALLLRFFSPLKWFVLLLILAWAAGSPINANFCWAYLGIYTGLGTLAIGLGIFKKYRLRLLTYATHEAVHRLSPAFSNELVIPFALASKKAYRVPAIPGLARPRYTRGDGCLEDARPGHQS